MVQEVKFSKRAGGYTTLRDLYEAVGVDVHPLLLPDAETPTGIWSSIWTWRWTSRRRIRSTRASTPMPGCAASCGRRASRTAWSRRPEPSWSGWITPRSGGELIKQLAGFPEVVSRAASARAPHLVCEFLEQTAGAVNSWYHAGNPSRNPELAVLTPDPELRAARLVLTASIRIVLHNALSILGIQAPERMERAEADPA